MAANYHVTCYGFRALEDYLPVEDYAYVLRELYRILCGLKSRNIRKSQIMAAVQRFETQALLPAFLSRLSSDNFLQDFEEALHRENFRGGHFYMPSFKPH